MPIAGPRMFLGPSEDCSVTLFAGIHGTRTNTFLAADATEVTRGNESKGST